ncbi:MAG: YqeG family HAD IIIA-type phosphatase [Candidatus Bipolaricaulota bacterium]|nr:YqeG family HAD IIIA-type phosphatase [Candidatus Bipolaricaulota bacterium]
MKPLRALRPDEIAPSICEIDYERLWRTGYRALIFDIDNTLGEWGCRALSEPTEILLRELAARGFSLGFLSNDGGQDRPRLKEQLRAWPVLWRAAKPRTRHYKNMLELLKTTETETVMIGDQLFTDIWGAKRAGLYAIFVAPVSPKTDSVWAKLRRPLERVVLRLLTGKDARYDDPDEREHEDRKSAPPH